MADAERSRSWVFYYDGHCGFCTQSVRLLAFSDFFRQVEWTDFRELSEPPIGLSWEDLDNAAYLEVTRASRKSAVSGKDNVKLYRGFFAFRMLAFRLALLFPLFPLLWLPGFDRLGEAAYAWVAANRYRISRRCRLKSGK